MAVTIAIAKRVGYSRSTTADVEVAIEFATSFCLPFALESGKRVADKSLLHIPLFRATHFPPERRVGAGSTSCEGPVSHFCNARNFDFQRVAKIR